VRHCKGSARRDRQVSITIAKEPGRPTRPRMGEGRG
jgi:hypothetical protein